MSTARISAIVRKYFLDFKLCGYEKTLQKLRIMGREQNKTRSE